MPLHDVTQVVVGWTDRHLCEFVIGEHVYGESLPDDDCWDRHVYKAAGIRPKTLTEREVDCFLYAYDFGDDWRHDVFLESVPDHAAGVRVAGPSFGFRRNSASRCNAFLVGRRVHFRAQGRESGRSRDRGKAPSVKLRPRASKFTDRA